MPRSPGRVLGKEEDLTKSEKDETRQKEKEFE